MNFPFQFTFKVHFLIAGVDCPTGMEYQTCSWNISCDEFGVVRDCRNSICQSGCFCSNGYVLEDGVCVHPDMCISKIILRETLMIKINTHKIHYDVLLHVADTYDI